MSWISNWIQGIIVAVIIGTIIEMILPEGNCKKYIKVVIGTYILFSIISPVITKITGNEFRVSDIFDIDKYIETSTSNKKNTVETNQQNQIKQIYISNLKEDIRQKIQAKEYEVKNISIEIEDNEQYTLRKIALQVIKQKPQSNVNEIQSINEIRIDIGNNEENEKNVIAISNDEERELKEYLCNVYNLDGKNIIIN